MPPVHAEPENSEKGQTQHLRTLASGLRRGLLRPGPLRSETGPQRRGGPVHQHVHDTATGQHESAPSPTVALYEQLLLQLMQVIVQLICWLMYS